MKLYLVQHGEAKPEKEDARRPLTGRCEKEIRVLGGLLRRLGVRANRILHSDKLRAIQSAQVLAGELRPNEVAVPDSLKPLDDPSVWVERSASVRGNLMLVGHMPHLGKLASRLLCGDERLEMGFVPGSAAFLERDEAGTWILRWMATPEIL